MSKRDNARGIDLRGYRVLLVCNYAPDGLQSMLRFGALMEQAIRETGVAVSVVAPVARFGRIGGRYRYGGWKKWLGYLDKYVVFPTTLRRTASSNDKRCIVHVIDHGNAMYVPRRRTEPWLITCHDLLTVRAALGESTHINPSRTGCLLQQWIMRGLRRADHVACDSSYTRNDWIRLAGKGDAMERSSVVPIALNHPYQQISRVTALIRLAQVGLGKLGERPFVLHVGSNERRKNRKVVLAAVAGFRQKHDCGVVLAGAPLSSETLELAKELGVSGTLTEVVRPDNDLLEALYSMAHALVFPSYFEGYGWPVLEAQACGCPVICSNTSSVPEIAGNGALLREPDDQKGITEDLLRLLEQAPRRELIDRGFSNVRLYSVQTMALNYTALYERLLLETPARIL